MATMVSLRISKLDKQEKLVVTSTPKSSLEKHKSQNQVSIKTNRGVIKTNMTEHIQRQDKIKAIATKNKH